MSVASRSLTPTSVGLGWFVVVTALAMLAVRTDSVVAWIACALAVGLPALTCMVMAHAPAKSIAQILWDAEEPR